MSNELITAREQAQKMMRGYGDFIGELTEKLWEAVENLENEDDKEGIIKILEIEGERKGYLAQMEELLRRG